jgi:hypothetical protein
MTRRAPSVCTAEADVEQLVALIAALPAHGHVVLRLRDGSTRAGVVQVRGSLQVFRDTHDREGLNAEIVLECPDVSGGIQHVWLDQIEDVEHLDSALGSES